MKPNDKALDEALSVTQIPEENMREYMCQVLTAAYAAQFQSEDYAGLVEALRSSAILGRRFEQSQNGWIDQYEKAADAIEALQAELKAQKEYNDVLTCKKLSDIARGAERYWEARWRDEAKENDKLKAERDAALAEIDAISSAIKSPRYMDPPDGDSVTIAEQVSRMWEDNETLRTERDALLARLAPVDNEALVDMAVIAIHKEAEKGPIFGGNLIPAAISAVRPHIEAAERERIDAAFEGTPLPLWVEQYEDQHPYRAATEYAEAIYAAIRSRK